MDAPILQCRQPQKAVIPKSQPEGVFIPVKMPEAVNDLHANIFQSPDVMLQVYISMLFKAVESNQSFWPVLDLETESIDTVWVLNTSSQTTLNDYNKIFQKVSQIIDENGHLYVPVYLSTRCEKYLQIFRIAKYNNFKLIRDRCLDRELIFIDFQYLP